MSDVDPISPRRTSVTGGPVVPLEAPAVVNGKQLDLFFQALVVGVTALPGPLVRRRWQEEPPNIPPREVTWAAVGVVNRKGDTFANVVELATPAGQGSALLTRNQELDVLCSFYGPDADDNAERLKSGMLIPQNSEVLYLAGMGFIECSEPIPVPAVVKGKYLMRVDTTLRVRRQIARKYPIEYLLGAVATILTDDGRQWLAEVDPDHPAP